MATHVHIRDDLIPNYALTLAMGNKDKSQLDFTAHYQGADEDTLAYYFVLGAINFGSGYFPHLRKRTGMSGYYTIASCLSDHFKHKVLKPADLLEITTRDCFSIFGQDPHNPTIYELMDLFAMSMKELGKYVMTLYHGDFANVVEAANCSAVRLVEILIGMPYYRDVSYYKAMDVAFFKRAQIMAADLHLAFGGEGFGKFDDLPRLTLFADNLVPHVLRLDGILEYNPELSWRIDSEEIIPSGSAEEIEIRACALNAVEQMVMALGGLERGISAMLLDNILWHRGQQPHYKQTKPRHRTRTVYY
jgi:hypothetical protein